MHVTTDTPDLLVLRFTRWKSPLIYSALSLAALWAGALMVRSPAIPAEDALAVSAQVSDWMHNWRRSLDSPPPAS